MADVLLLGMILVACAATGYPLGRLLPVQSIRDRAIAAPVLGFAVISSVTILLYKLGVPPGRSLRAICALGSVVAAGEIWRSRRSLPLPELGRVAAAALLVLLVCLLPAWTGGSDFKIFQGNVYDQFHSYLNGTVVFHRYPYATVVSARDQPGANPIVAEARHAAINRPISVVHAAFAGTHPTALASAYAFMAALQALLFFSALFVTLSVFDARLSTGLSLAGALTVGFFQQHVVDTDAWSELATLPLCVLVLAVAVLTRDFWREGTGSGRELWKAGLMYSLLLLPVTLIYPEAWGVYAVTVALALAPVARGPRQILVNTAAVLLFACSVSLLLTAWQGSLPFLIPTTREALTNVEWWKYFQAYVLGRHPIAVSTGAPHAWAFWSSAWFIRPIDAAAGVLGLYWFLPSPSLSVPLATAVRLGLYTLRPAARECAGPSSRRNDPRGIAAMPPSQWSRASQG